MPISSPSSPSLWPSNRSSTGNVKDIGGRLSHAQGENAPLLAAAGEALINLQRQCDSLVRALQQSTPIPEPLQITAPDGSLIAEIGVIIDRNANASYSGIWGNNLYIGGQGPASAPFFSNGQMVVVGQNGQVFVLDPYANIGAWLGTQSEATQSVTGAANDTGLIRLTVTAHGYRNGDWVNVANVGGVPNATGQWVIQVIDANHFDLLGSTFAGAYTSGGTVGRYFSGGAFETVAVAAGQRITNAANNGSGLVRLTITGHGYKTGYAVVTTNVGGVPGANGSFLVTVIDANTVDLQGSTFSGSYTGGGISINWPTAKLLAQGDGSLIINNATITLIGPNGTILIDPTDPGITITGNSITTRLDNANTAVSGIAAGVVVYTTSGNTYPTQISSGSIIIAESLSATNRLNLLANAATSELTMHYPASAGAGLGIRLQTGFGLTISDTLGNNVGVIDITGNGSFAGTVDAALFSKSGTPGISVTRNMVASVTTGTAVTSVTGTGISTTTGTFVTGVTLTATTFTGGIITA